MTQLREITISMTRKIPLVRIVFSSVAILMANAVSMQAALLYYESFDYTAGQSLSGMSGGEGFDNSWGNVLNNGSITVTSPGATYPQLSTEGNRATLTPGTADAAAFRLLDAPIDSGTIYISFLAQNTNGGNRFLALSLYDGGNSSGNEKLTMGQVNGASTWGSTGSLTTSVSSANATLIVMRIDFNAGGNETLSMYLNPTSDIEPLTPNGTGSREISSFDRFRIASGFGSGGNTSTVGWIDEIRIGTTFADVAPVPEPQTFILLGLGLGALFLRKRRQHA